MENGMRNVGSRGYSITELIVVLSLLAIVAAIALPFYVQWRSSVDYRTTARYVSSILRDARSRTINTNRQHRVEFQPVAPATAPPSTLQYRMTQGNLAANSSTWNTIIQEWTTLPRSVTMVSANMQLDGVTNFPFVSFQPDGTANVNVNPPATVQIRDATGVVRFTVQIESTGRIVIL
jgi:prepilin-type N-terminal cleavage/methylation domain-containing protein